MADMNFNLKKGMSFDLEKAKPGLKKVRITLKWKDSGNSYPEMDADLSVVVLGDKDGTRKIHAMDPSWVLYFNSPDKTVNGETVKATPNNEIIHWGDNRSGGFHNGVDGEQADIDFSLLPETAVEIAILGTIYEGKERNQNWNQLAAILEISDVENDQVLASYQLENDFPTQVAIHPGSFIKTEKGQWTFEAVGKGSDGGLGDYLGFWS